MLDIARESGVSLSTVSLVLNDKPGLSEETRERVLATARSLGYRSKMPAPTVRQGIKTLGLIVKTDNDEPDVPRSNVFYSQVIGGIESACRQNNLNLLYSTVRVNDLNEPVEIPNLLLEDSADALLLVGIYVNRDFTKVLEKNNLPLILVDGYSETGQFDSVITSNSDGAAQATRHLLELGHTRVAFLGSTDDGYPSLKERREGYYKAMHEAGLQPLFFNCSSRPADMAESIRKIFGANTNITALVGVNDYIVINSMKYITQMGISIPQDVSLVGFDDIALSENISPPLTTMRIDKTNMGRMAVNLLLHRVETPDAFRITAVMHTRLIKRASTQAVKPIRATENKSKA